MQGAFGALLAPSALALLTTTFTTEYLSWRWCLYVNVAFAAALAGAVPLIGNQPRNPGATLDVPGSLLVAGGLAGIVYGFSQAAVDGSSTTPKSSPSKATATGSRTETSAASPRPQQPTTNHAGG